MADSRPIVPVLAFLGIIHAPALTDDDVLRILGETFGRLEPVSPVSPFSNTDYYEEEMGPHLRRRFFGLPGLLDPSSILDVKDRTKQAEARWARDGRRRINIDPGYLDAHKVVLISEKYSGRKISLGRGYYADITLSFIQGRVLPHERSFPDFRNTQRAGNSYGEFFLALRRLYLERVRQSTFTAG